jgi:predicted ATPase
LFVFLERSDTFVPTTYVAELQPLAGRHILPILQALSMLFEGAVLGLHGRPQEGLEIIEQGTEMMANLQIKLYQPGLLLIRSELLTNLERVQDALVCISDGFDIVSVSHEHWGNTELHRVCGEFHASLAQESEAEVAFTAALAIAREQKAKWWELRAATSLAQLWQSQEKSHEARELLTSIYDWFTEGLDTADLTSARALLDEFP